MSESILNSVKKVLNIPADYDVFDQDIIMHINSAFSTLHQLGIGPSGGFMIEDDVPTWDTFTLGDLRYNSVKTYVSLKVRLVFDPPSAGFVIDMMKQQIDEYEWRLNVVHEGDINNPILPDAEIVYDGGTP